MSEGLKGDANDGTDATETRSASEPSRVTYATESADATATKNAPCVSARPEASARPDANDGPGAGVGLDALQSADASAQTRARQLEMALAELGLEAHVEARGALAILVINGDTGVLDPAARRASVRAAHESGFTHVAVEVSPSVDSASGR